jgi:hypothetical protein
MVSKFRIEMELKSNWPTFIENNNLFECQENYTAKNEIANLQGLSLTVCIAMAECVEYQLFELYL